MEQNTMQRHVRWPLFVAALLVALAPWVAPSQTNITRTTLSAAVSETASTVSVASATTVTAGNYLYVESPYGGPGELMSISSVSGTTATVRRGVNGTQAMSHLNGMSVWAQAAHAFYAADPYPMGGCTQANQLFLPHINARTGAMFDCDARGVWMPRPTDGSVRDENEFRYWVKFDTFDNGYAILQDDGSAESVTDDEDNLVWGSPLGIIEFRIDETHTTSPWVISDGELDMDGDSTDNEGVEILWGVAEGADFGIFTAGTNGACISASIELGNISATDQVQLGFRQNETFVDANDYTGYTVWNTVGINNVDGSIFSSQEVSEATDTDDSGVNWADGESRALRVCVSAAGVPSAYYTADIADDEYPFITSWTAITMTETGSTWTADVQGVPYLSFLKGAAEDASIRVNWVKLESAP
jgi:hypothetical protein